MGFATLRNARDLECNLHGSNMQVDVFSEQLEKSVRNDVVDFPEIARYCSDASTSTNENFLLIIEILAGITPH